MLRRVYVTSVCLATMALVMTSCSWLAMKKLPSNWRAESPPRCSTSWLPPISDLAVGAGVAAAGLGFGSHVASSCDSNCELGYLATGVIVTAALVQWFAATDGLQYAARCRRAHRQRRTFIRGY